jgi:glycosyltransferase-like protein
MSSGGPLNIGLLTHSVNPRGGVIHALELASALHAAGHRVTVMAPAAAGQQMFREVPFPIELIPTARLSADLLTTVMARINAYVSHLTAHPARSGFDILHAQDGISANALRTLREKGMIPSFIYTVHHVDRFGDPQVDALQELAIREAGRVFCVSDIWRNTLECDYGVKASLVQNGVDLKRYSPRRHPSDRPVARSLGLRPGAPLIVSIGGIEERKNSIRVLEAFIHLRERLPDAQLAIVGGASLLDHSSYASQFRAAVLASGLSVGPAKDLVLTGTLPDAQMPAVFRLADVLAFPSLREGFGLVVLESLASGTPVAVSRIAPFTEYLTDEVEWADPLDSDSLARALLAALRRPVNLASPAVCTRLSWTASAAGHIALYREFAREMSCPPCTTAYAGPTAPKRVVTRRR